MHFTKVLQDIQSVLESRQVDYENPTEGRAPRTPVIRSALTVNGYKEERKETLTRLNQIEIPIHQPNSSEAIILEVLFFESDGQSSCS
jgi:hypothetical protein